MNRTIRELLLLFPGRQPYYERVLHTRHSDLIGYYPMWEPSGTAATDLSPEGNAGKYTAVTLGQPGIGDGKTCPLFSVSCNDLIASDIENDFSGAEGAVAMWLRVANVGVWTDATSRRALYIYVDGGQNRVALTRTTTNNTFQLLYESGDQDKASNIVMSTTDWFHVAITWSAAADTCVQYINGAPVQTYNALGAWAGVPSTFIVGAQNSTPAIPWSGYIAHPAFWTVALSAPEVLRLTRL